MSGRAIRPLPSWEEIAGKATFSCLGPPAASITTVSP